MQLDYLQLHSHPDIYCGSKHQLRSEKHAETIDWRAAARTLQQQLLVISSIIPLCESEGALFVWLQNGCKQSYTTLSNWQLQTLPYKRIVLVYTLLQSPENTILPARWGSNFDSHGCQVQPVGLRMLNRQSCQSK